MRYLLIVSSLLLLSLGTARAEVQVGVSVSVPGVSIGINMPSYPRLVRVPDYPVYYDPEADGNYFFYDGLYWVFHEDDWYASSWYDGPWDRVEHDYVPLYVLRVPVRYYRKPPKYFHGWKSDSPPHWGDRWGRDWEQHRKGWDKWDHHSSPPPAPLPTYQQHYNRNPYPHDKKQQDEIRSQHYRYQPREPVTQKYYQGGHKGKGQKKQDDNRKDDNRQGGHDNHDQDHR
jgi:hypothetical protein